MNLVDLRAFLRKYRWWIASFLIVAFGYQVGKDMALRDNVRDTVQRAGSVN